MTACTRMDLPEHKQMTLIMIFNLTTRGKAVADVLGRAAVFLDGTRYRRLEIVMYRLI